MKKILLIMFILLSFPLGLFALTANAETSDADSLGAVEITDVISVDSTTVTLTWRDDTYSYMQDGFKIYRATSKKGEYSEVGSLYARYTTSYTDRNLTPGQKYYYKICKYTDPYDPKCGPFSNIKSGKPVPKKMTFSAVSNEKDSVTLTWTESAEASVSGYNIYRASSPDGEFEFIKKIKKRSTTSYTDKTAEYGEFYYYKMRAFSIIDGETVYGTKSDPVRNQVNISQCRAYFTKVGPLSSNFEEFYSCLKLKYGDHIYTKDQDFYIGSVSRWISGNKITQLRFTAYGRNADLAGSKEFTVRPISAKATLNNVSITNSGVQVTWNKESGALGYKVYRKTGSGSYGKVKTITDNEVTSWTDTKATKTDTKYSYFVKAYTKLDGVSQHSERSDIMSVKMLSTPKLDDVTNQKQGIVFAWKSVKSAKSYDVLRKTGSGDWEFLANTTDLQYTDKDVDVGKEYTYTVCCSDGPGARRVSKYNSKGLKVTRCVAAEGKSLGSDSVKISWNKAKKADGYVVYRATSKSGTYKKIKTIKDSGTLSYTDDDLTFGKYYYYKIRPYTLKNDKKVYGEYGTVAKIRPTIATVSVKSVKATSPTKVKVTWKAVKGATAYQIYRASYENGTYTKVKTVKGNDTTSYTVSGLENGNTYYFKVRGYKEVKGEKYYGSYSSVKSCYIDMLGYADESYYSKNQRIWGSNEYVGFETSSEAWKSMKTIKIKTWDINSKGKKYTREHYVTVHKNLADTVEAIFEEIYNGKEKFPIKSVGGYAWRGNGLSSQHGAGLALDINPNENAQFNGDTGKPQVGSYWKPGEDPYSIPPDGDVVRAFEKYGFGWGDWFPNPDYMHFSYYGI